MKAEIFKELNCEKLGINQTDLDTLSKGYPVTIFNDNTLINLIPIDKRQYKTNGNNKE